MNVFLFTDVEGLPGISAMEQIDRTGESYSAVRENITDCIIKTADFCLANGAETVYYLDGHAGGGNVYPDRITNAVKIDKHMCAELLAAGKIDCMMEIGNHARAGTVGGFLDHTMNSGTVFAYKIDGVEQSELSLHALVCAAYGVPTVMCCGDVAACVQAKEYIPDIVAAPVKKASVRNSCECFENAYEIIEAAVKQALGNYKSIKLMECPVANAEVEITYYRTDMCEAAMQKASCDYVRKDARTLVKKLGKITDFSCYSF